MKFLFLFLFGISVSANEIVTNKISPPGGSGVVSVVSAMAAGPDHKYIQVGPSDIVHAGYDVANYPDLGEASRPFGDAWVTKLRNNTQITVQGGTVSFSNSKTTVTNGIRLGLKSADPCADTSNYPTGTMFYNSTNNFYCFCDGAGDDKQVHSPGTDCF